MNQGTHEPLCVSKFLLGCRVDYTLTSTMYYYVAPIAN